MKKLMVLGLLAVTGIMAVDTSINNCLALMTIEADIREKGNYYLGNQAIKDLVVEQGKNYDKEMQLRNEAFIKQADPVVSAHYQALLNKIQACKDLPKPKTCPNFHDLMHDLLTMQIENGLLLGKVSSPELKSIQDQIQKTADKIEAHRDDLFIKNNGKEKFAQLQKATKNVNECFDHLRNARAKAKLETSGGLKVMTANLSNK